MKTTKEEAMNWWNTFSTRDKLPLFRKYYSSGVTCLMDITEEEIENIWRNEMMDSLEVGMTDMDTGIL